MKYSMLKYLCIAAAVGYLISGGVPNFSTSAQAKVSPLAVMYCQRDNGKSGTDRKCCCDISNESGTPYRCSQGQHACVKSGASMVNAGDADSEKQGFTVTKNAEGKNVCDPKKKTSADIEIFFE